MDPVLALTEMRLRELRDEAAAERLAAELRRARRAARPDGARRAGLRERFALRPRSAATPCTSC